MATPTRGTVPGLGTVRSRRELGIRNDPSSVVWVDLESRPLQESLKELTACGFSKSDPREESRPESRDRGLSGASLLAILGLNVGRWTSSQQPEGSWSSQQRQFDVFTRLTGRNKVA
jgi:hypothetical protein